jgi:hypothetical protein
MSTLESLFSGIPLDSTDQQPVESTDTLTPTASSVLSPTIHPSDDNKVSTPPAASSNAERQNALLNMLGATASPQFTPTQISQSPVQQPPIHPSQIPTPPGSAPAHRSEAGSTRSEQQGKALLDHLMNTRYCPPSFLAFFFVTHKKFFSFLFPPSYSANNLGLALTTDLGEPLLRHSTWHQDRLTVLQSLALVLMR